MFDTRQSRPTQKWAISVHIGLLAALVAAPTFAEEATSMEEVVVTGSRIPRQDLSGPSPVSIYDRSNIEQSGATSIGQMLREIPAVAGQAQSTNVNNGGSGSQNISLRGLGSQRTLVLINGRRAPDSSGGNDGLVDLNTIPVSLVERVEVLKDGASATYGSDAIAGVVNIIYRNDFEGLEVSAQTGESSESDGKKTQYSLTIGQNFDDGSNFVVNLSRIEEDETVAGHRSWARQAKFLLGGNWVDGGSSAPPWGRYRGFDVGGETKDLTLGPDYAGGTEAGGLRSYSSATDSYNYAPVNYQRQPNERWIVNALGKVNIDSLSNLGILESTRAFTEISYIDRESSYALAEQPLAPLAFYGFTAPYSAKNEYNKVGVDIPDWRRRLVEDGPRTGFTEIRTVRGVGGLEGELSNGITWEVYFNYGEVDYSNDYGPLFNLHKVANATGPTARDDEGVVRCDTSGDGTFSSDDAADCIPLNVFGENSITREMADYIGFRQKETNKVTQKIWGLNLTKADLFELPGGNVGMSVGYNYRKEQGRYTPDALVAELAESGAVTGTPSDVTAGGYTVEEVYLEVRLPVLASLEADLGFRYSDYDTFGDTDNWKVGFQWRPMDDLLIRGSGATAFRAPNVEESFGGAGISFPSVSDPCAQNPTPNCIASGVPAAGFTQISTQIRTQVGGNADAQPEEAETFTLGLVYQPSFLEGVAFAIDYYDIEIDNPITTVGTSTILSQCAESGAYCGLVQRFGPGPNEGAPLLVDNRTTNAGKIEASGMDLLIEWRDIETSLGTFGIRWEGSYTDEYDKTLADGTVEEHAGFFRDEGDGHFAEWKWTLSGMYERGPWTLQVDYRFIDEVTEFGEDLLGSCVGDDGMEQTPGGNVGLQCVTKASKYAGTDLGKFVRTIDDISYFDAYASYDFEKVKVFAGIDNVTDEEPPLSVDGFNDNTDVRTFDTIGRYYYLGFRTNF